MRHEGKYGTHISAIRQDEVLIPHCYSAFCGWHVLWGASGKLKIMENLICHSFNLPHTTGWSILYFFIVLLWIWALASNLFSSSSIPTKILWFIVILLFPILGAVLYFFFGRRAQQL